MIAGKHMGDTETSRAMGMLSPFLINIAKYL